MTSKLTVGFVSLLLAVPPLIFWVWLVILPGRVSNLCPEKCSCGIGGSSVTCYKASLSAVPLFHFTNIRELWLHYNNITLLKEDSFVTLTDLQFLDISKGLLRTIELGAFNGLTKLKKLDIGYNEISEIIPGTFQNMNSLEYLDLRKNLLLHLDSGVFSGLNELKEIYLDRNKLQNLHPGSFLGLPNLQELNLNYNPHLTMTNDTFSSLTELQKLFIIKSGLRAIEIGAFNGLTKLTRLNLWDNEISEILPGTFESMSSLEILDLLDNRLEQLDSGVFRGLVNIKEIRLIKNKLQYLHPDTFLGLPNIKIISLSNNPTLQIPTDRPFINSHYLSHLLISQCNISSLSVETFSNVSALEEIDLGYNNLSTLDINILRSLPKLSKMYLYGNPLQCDCQLQEVWQWCKDRNIQSEASTWVPQCDTPTEVKGMWWGVLEKGQCLEGNIQYYGDYNSRSCNDTDIYTDNKDYEYDYDYEVMFFKHYNVRIYVFPFIFGTISNVILLIIIICNKDMRTLPNMYIINLAISDIIYLTLLFSEAFAKGMSDTWLEGVFMCTFLPFFRRMSVCLSAYSVALFSFQRYRVTVNPFQALVSSQATWRGIVATICAVWIVAALFAVPTVQSNYQCGLVDMYITNYYKLVVIFELLVSCVLPLCVVAFSYVMTARHLVKSSRSISEGTQNPQLNTRRNTAKIVVGLTVVFLISYVPYHAFWTYVNCTREVKIFSEKITDIHIYWDYKLRYTYQISTCFLLINSCLNPVALFCISSPFRQHLKSYLTCFCKTNSAPTDLELERRN